MLSTLVGATVGAGLMYAMDPVSGGRRRALVRDQLSSAGGRVLHARAATLRDLRNRAEGMWAEMRSCTTTDQVTDDVLEQRVRSGLGPRVRFPRHIEAHALDGVVTLTGDVPADEVERLVRFVRGVRGVGRVDNRLRVHDDPADLPGVQPPIPPRPSGPRPDVMQENWSPGTRALMGAGGASLMAAGCRFGPAVGLAMVAIGALTVLRAVTNEPLFGRSRPPGGRRRNGFESPAEAGDKIPADAAW